MAGFNWKNQRQRRNLLDAMIFLLPNIFGVLAFVAFPVLFSFVMAFTNWDLTQREPLAFVGIENFKQLLWGENSQLFWKYFFNTLYFMMGMPLSIAGSLLLALLLHRPIRIGKRTGTNYLVGAAGLGLGLIGGGFLWIAGSRDTAFLVMVLASAVVLGAWLGVVFFRTMFYLPQFTFGVAVFILWRNLYHPDFGLVSRAFGRLTEGVVGLAGVVPVWMSRFLVAGIVAAVVVFLIHRWKKVAADYWLEGFKGVVKEVFVNGLILAAGGAAALFFWILPTLAGIETESPRWLISVENLWAMNPETVWPTSRFFGLGARDALVFMGVWAGIGGANMLLYLAGLSNIPVELHEIAEIDGAGKWARFWNVTWPQLAPTTFFIVVISVIGGLQGGFEQARVMTEGGPAGTTVTLGYYIYLVGFEEFRLGLASAIAWMMFIIIFIITLVNWRYGNRYVNV